MTPEERWAVQKGIQYKKIYDNPIDNFIASREEMKKKCDAILQEQEEKKKQKEFEEQIEKQIEEQVQKAIDKALKKFFS